MHDDGQRPNTTDTGTNGPQVIAKRLSYRRSVRPPARNRRLTSTAGYAVGKAKVAGQTVEFLLALVHQTESRIPPGPVLGPGLSQMKSWQIAGGLERIVVVRHPTLREGPVELEASEDEIESIRSRALRLVSLTLLQDNGSPSETVTIDIEAFNKLAGDRDMAEVLRQAESANQRHEQTKPSTASTNDGLSMPVVASPEKTLTMPVVVSDEETAVTMPASASTAEVLPKPADASSKESCGI